MTHIARIVAPLLMVAGMAAACGRSERSGLEGSGMGDSATLAGSVAKPAQLHVSNVMIGRQIGPGNRITEPTFQFAPQDTVFVSVATEGAGEGVLTAAWRSQSGEILQKSSEPVTAADENTPFYLSQPKGLKQGTYKVIVFLGDDSVETRVFAVRK